MWAQDAKPPALGVLVLVGDPILMRSERSPTPEFLGLMTGTDPPIEGLHWVSGGFDIPICTAVCP